MPDFEAIECPLENILVEIIFGKHLLLAQLAVLLDIFDASGSSRF